MLMFVLSQAGCTALLLGGAESGEYPEQTKKDCEKNPDQEHC